jgi:hypothetical protein
MGKRTKAAILVSKYDVYMFCETRRRSERNLSDGNKTVFMSFFPNLPREGWKTRLERDPRNLIAQNYP